MQTKSKLGKYAAIAGLLGLLAFFASTKVNVKFAPRDLAFGQTATLPYLGVTVGAPVNGKISLIPTTQTLDTQTTVAAGTLNGTNSPAYDCSQLNERARMINISFNVTAVPGTSPSLTPTFQESDDGQITWYTVNAQDGSNFAAITSTGAVTGKDFPIYGDACRIHYVSSGTGNFTFTDSGKQAQ